MKRILTILSCLAFTASLQAGMFGWDSSISFHLGKDPRKWTLDHTATRFFLEGDSIKSWKEMASLQVDSNTMSLRKYVDVWKDGLPKTDSKIDFKEESLGDGSIIVTYTSQSADETSIRRFIKSKDGIYILAYYVHPKFKTDETFAIWDSIIRTATLIPSHLDEFVWFHI
jgi:hypothetical protein